MNPTAIMFIFRKNGEILDVQDLGDVPNGELEQVLEDMDLRGAEYEIQPEERSVQ